MAYLVDGNNLCGAARDRRLGLPMSEDEMIRSLGRFAAARRALLTVVFDGAVSSRRRGRSVAPAGRVRVLYSGATRSADDAILAMVGDAKNPRDITLVTSDRELAGRARGIGCRVIGCREFSERVASALADARDEEESKPVAGDIEEWMRYFDEQ